MIKQAYVDTLFNIIPLNCVILLFQTVKYTMVSDTPEPPEVASDNKSFTKVNSSEDTNRGTLICLSTTFKNILHTFSYR